MINRKPFLFILFMFLSIFFESCDSDKSLIFEKQRITTNVLTACENRDCASIEINMIQCIQDSENAEIMNREIENIACQILNVSENEPEETLESAMSEFNSFYQEMKSEYPEETVPYEATIDYEISFQNRELISLLVDFYTFTGGAHGYGAISFLNLDSTTGTQLSSTTLLKDYNHFKKHIEVLFRKKYQIDAAASINSTGFFFENDTFTLPENLGFSEEDVILVFNQYEIGSYAEGPIELRVKKSDVASFFKVDIN